VLHPIIEATLEETPSPPLPTPRGSAGFGSSGL
jgi:hypothetical protein